MIPCIKAVEIRNYKSLAQVTVTDLGPFTVLVGPNASGKSNFVDALAFVQECLSESIELALKKRGGISAVRHIGRIGCRPTDIEFRIMMVLDASRGAEYSFKIASSPTVGLTVARERCRVLRLMHARPEHTFEVQNGRFVKGIPGIRPKVAPDRLALYAASATDEFRPVYDFLTSMRFYSIVPVQLRELQGADPGNFLKRDGSNAAAVLKRLQDEPKSAERYKRVCSLLSKMVDSIRGVEYKTLGKQETIRFKLDVGSKQHLSFDALNMSDGTLRALGVFLAVYQSGKHSLVAIEEPEATVHPAAAEVIVQALIDASQERQVIITTHSPDILDYKQMRDTDLRTVTMENGQTVISPLSISSREAIRERLYTPGELLRAGELTPDKSAASQSAKQLGFLWEKDSGQAH